MNKQVSTEARENNGLQIFSYDLVLLQEQEGNEKSLQGGIAVNRT
jgi:hypothetical protein